MIQIDEIGTLYDAPVDEETPAVALPGYHVNSTYPVAEWAAYKVTPATPRRIFGGIPTYFYTFASQAEYESLPADLTVTPPVVPQTLSRAQAKLALLGAGLLGAVQPAIDAVPDATMRAAMQIEWDDRLTFERSNPTLIALATGLGMTSEQLDQLFIAGATL